MGNRDESERLEAKVPVSVLTTAVMEDLSRWHDKLERQIDQLASLTAGLRAAARSTAAAVPAGQPRDAEPHKTGGTDP